MNKVIQSIIFLLVLFLIISCDSRKKQEKLADIRLKNIEQLIYQNSLNAAKIEIDSVNLLFPRLINKRKVAAALKDTIVRIESSRSLEYCDSILPKKQHEFDSIVRNFRFEKNKKYQEFGNYIYKTQITESNSTRTYLKTYVDENADIYLISNYCGRKIEQNSVEVSVDGLFARTDTIEASNPNYFAFNDEGSHWETLTYKNDADKGVTAFIGHYVSKSIKVTLHGKNNYSYYLENSDKQAIAQTFNLWIVKKDIRRLQFEIKKAIAIIERIKMEKKSNLAKSIDKK